MKTLALCLILAAPAFAQVPAHPQYSQKDTAPAPQQLPQAAVPAPPQNPCQMLVSVETLDTLTPSALKLQIVYANQCILSMQAQRLQSDFQRAGSDLAAKAKQLEAETKPAESKKEGTK